MASTEPTRRELNNSVTKQKVSADRRPRDTGRHLDVAEQAAAARVWPLVAGNHLMAYSYGRGPIHWAIDDYWPKQFEARAAEWEQLAADARLMARVMRERDR